MRALTPIILILASVGLFFFQINPQYTDVKILRAESVQYDEALKVALELKKIRGELANKLSSFSPEELQKLQRFMPERLDTVKIILDVNGIASNYAINLKDIKVSDLSQSTQASGDEIQTPYNTTSVSFSFLTSYSNGEKFIKNLEESLRLMDVASIAIKSSDKTPGGYDFGLTLNTYWVSKK